MMIVTCPNCGARNRLDEERARSMQPVCGRCRTKLHAVGHAGNYSPVDITDATFEATLRGAGETPVLVDCWAPWCGPCKMIAPTVDALAAESHGQYIVAKLNVDENPQAAQRLDIRSIPALLIFKAGRLVDKLVGVQPAELIQERLAAQM